MIKIVLKVTLFVLPFMILYGLNQLLFDQHQGDLIRLGYIYDNPIPKTEINRQFEYHSINFDVFNSKLNRKDFDLLTIGDSFSEMDEYGYQNFIQHNSSLKLLHINHGIVNNNQIQTLHDLALGDFFDNVKVKYVILQCVQRSIVQRSKNQLKSGPVSYDSLIKRVDSQTEKDKNYVELDFFKRSTIKIPLINFLLKFQQKPLDSKTYKFRTDSKDYFSNKYDDALIFQDDIQAVKLYNHPLNLKMVNSRLNAISDLLNMKGIKLIVLISPDKFNIYYDRMEANNLAKPHFFEDFQMLKKKYLFIPAFDAIRSRLNSVCDLYYYDDSHWSPKTSKIIGELIIRTISEDKN